MARSNPFKKKRRTAKSTLLIYGEGMSEEIFLKYLRELYSHDSGIAVTVRKGKGGNAKEIVISAMKIPGNFDKRIVVLDNDKSEQEIKNAEQEAIKYKIELLKNTPCLEAMLLSILKGGKSFANKPSKWCKKEFEEKYISKKKRSEKNEYAKLFPKKILDEQSNNLPVLKKIIDSMSGI